MCIRDSFRDEARQRPGLRALCLLDRDDEAGPDPATAASSESSGLEYFTWSRRHIESYLLVPAAVRRVLEAGERAKLDRAVRDHFPAPGDERALREMDAKRLLGKKGPIVRILGRPLSLAQVARATREQELHQDVRDLFAKLARELSDTQPTLHRH